MARNPYSGVGNADPYTNGNGYGGLGGTSRSNEGEYDPYGERYGSPPTTNGERDRRPARNGAYGGFGDPPPAVQPVTSRQPPGGYSYDTYNSRPEEPAPPRSPRRVRMPESRMRQDGGYGDTNTRRRGERQYTNGDDDGNALVSNRNRGATRGGSGARQIGGRFLDFGLLHDFTKSFELLLSISAERATRI